MSELEAENPAVSDSVSDSVPADVHPDVPPTEVVADPDSEAEAWGFERVWGFAVLGGAVGSLVGLLASWPAFPAAFATVCLWVVQRRGHLGKYPRRSTAVIVAWLVAIFLTIGSWTLKSEVGGGEGPYPGSIALEQLWGAQPWLVFFGAALAALGAGLVPRWAEGAFAPWVWAVLAGYLAIGAAEAGRAFMGAESLEIEALLRGVALGPACGLIGGVLFSAARAADDRRFAWAAGVALAAGLGATAFA